jgi:hypothetical protein
MLRFALRRNSRDSRTLCESESVDVGKRMVLFTLRRNSRDSASSCESGSESVGVENGKVRFALRRVSREFWTSGEKEWIAPYLGYLTLLRGLYGTTP